MPRPAFLLLDEPSFSFRAASMFVLIFSLLFLLTNVYVYHTISRGLPAIPAWAIIAPLAIAFTSLFLAIVLERSRRLKASLPFAWVGYTWLGMSCLFATVAAIFDLIQLIDSRLLGETQALACVSAATLALTGLGWLSARGITVRKHKLSSEKFKPEKGLSQVRILQISDLHLGDSSRLSRVKLIVDKANELEPDIIVFTGDLFDGYLPMMGPFVEELKRLDPSIGKFAIIGNHECYAGIDDCAELAIQAGLKLLRNETLLLPHPISLVGIDDPTLSGPAATDDAEAQALQEVADDQYVVLLKHRPVVLSSSIDRFDLQLSGHTHGGQILPFTLITKIAYPAPIGLSKPSTRSRLYQSRGAGSWGPQLRVLSPPEIAVFDIQGAP